MAGGDKLQDGVAADEARPTGHEDGAPRVIDP